MRIKQYRAYAYVTSESCVSQRAVLPGAEIGQTPVARHGDYTRWTDGKRTTAQLAKTATGWKRRAAQLVMKLHGWERA